MTKKIEPKEARQGRSRKNVAVVLGISLALAVGILLLFQLTGP